ncbi:MAG: hypothetical protein ACI9LM_003261 [Alteromonadaceae bacterium]|jgi:hypothetical protein
MKSPVDKLLKEHKSLVHSEALTVDTHIQREQDDWIINTIMVKGINVPFKYKRKKVYKSLAMNQVNITYYPGTESIAGFEMEVMNVVRVKLC